jgi:hypothetical protein
MVAASKEAAESSVRQIHDLYHDLVNRTEYLCHR